MVMAPKLYGKYLVVLSRVCLASWIYALAIVTSTENNFATEKTRVSIRFDNY